MLVMRERGSEMGKQIYYEDLHEGEELPALTRETSVVHMGRWAGASSDYAPVHYDKVTGESYGFPDAIVQGKLKAAYLIELVTDWMGIDGWIRKFNCQYRRTDPIRSALVMKGRIVKKYVEETQHLVDLEIWTETPDGEKTTIASATIVSPSRSGA